MKAEGELSPPSRAHLRAGSGPAHARHMPQRIKALVSRFAQLGRRETVPWKCPTSDARRSPIAPSADLMQACKDYFGMAQVPTLLYVVGAEPFLAPGNKNTTRISSTGRGERGFGCFVVSVSRNFSFTEPLNLCLRRASCCRLEWLAEELPRREQKVSDPVVVEPAG